MSFRATDPNPCDLKEPAADAGDEIKPRDQRRCRPGPNPFAARDMIDRPETDAGNGPRRRRVSVFCTDDHAGFREVVRDLIGATPDFVLVGEASSGAAAIALVPQLCPDLVLIDVHMPGMSGFEAAARLGGDHSPLIVLMSASPFEVPPGLAFVAKQELSPRRLRDLWNGRRPL